MKTIILIGTPKSNIEKSGSYLIAKAFVSKMKEPCKIYSIQKESREKLISLMKDAENIIIITPNYIHSIPSGVLEFLHQMPKAREGQSIAFIVQAGYEESRESATVCRYLKKSRLHYRKELCFCVMPCHRFRINLDGIKY